MDGTAGEARRAPRWREGVTGALRRVCAGPPRAEELPRRAVEGYAAGIRRLEQVAARGLSHQRLQRVYRRKDPHPLPRYQVDLGFREDLRQSIQGPVLRAAGKR